jgi:hypothetical protein
MNDADGPMTALAEIVRQLGFDVTHAHQDLVFISNNLFIIKFSDPIHNIEVYYNEEIEEAQAVELMGRIDAAASERGFKATYKGAYCMTENEDGTVSVEFFDLTQRQDYD